MSSYCKFLLRFISDNELFMAMLFKEGYIYMCVCAYIVLVLFSAELLGAKAQKQNEAECT